MNGYPLPGLLTANLAKSPPDSANLISTLASMVVSKLGIVATSQALASQAGAQILAQGGSAADAAIAANAVLGVVEPMMDGIGGDLFAIEWDEGQVAFEVDGDPEAVYHCLVHLANNGEAQMSMGKTPAEDLFQL